MRSSTRTQRIGKAAVVGQRDGDLGRFADLARRGVAVPLGSQIVCPAAGEIT